MTVRISLALAAAVVAASAAGCTTWSDPEPPGAHAGAHGDIVSLRVPNPHMLGSLVVAPDESYVVGFTSGGGEWRGEDQAIKYALDGTVLASRDLYATAVAGGQPSGEIAAQSMLDLTSCAHPTLRTWSRRSVPSSSCSCRS